MNKKNWPILLLIVISWILFLYHQTIYQPLLSQGDHGRDLYAFWATMQGKVPYRDYWWVYGPLMPYYYALVYKILGVSIHATLIGQCFLKLISGLFIFSALELFIPAIIAYISTLWFWMFYPDFFFTYSHTGGITLLMAIIYFLFSYLRQPKKSSLYGALLCALLLCFVKINFGLIAWMMIGSFALIQTFVRRIHLGKNFYLLGGLLFPATVLIIYSAILWGMPVYAIRQCLPYLGDDQPYNVSMFLSARMLFKALVTNPFLGLPNFLLAVVVIISSVKLIGILRAQSTEKRWQLGSALILLVGFYFLNLHEYLKSGVLYRLNWSTPFSLVLLFFIIGVVLAGKDRVFHWLFSASLIFILVPMWQGQLSLIASRKLPEQYLPPPRGQVITSNDQGWFDTVKNTTDFLNRNLKPGEKFFALPYDPLYYFLTQRLSPTRMLIFFDHIKIPHQQEQTIIEELEKNNVQYVLLSSRSRFVSEYGLGTFGVTYGTLLAPYIQKNFKPVAMFGDWTSEPGWGWSHGTQILKRIR